MEIRRFFVSPNSLDGDIFTVSGEEFHHAIKVLRHKVGYKIIVCDGSGYDYFCTITEILGNCFKASVEDRRWNETNPTKKLVLYQCISRNDRFDFTVQKAVELGASEIVPVVSEYSTEKEINAERLERIISEASKQCGLAILPRLSAPVTFREAICSAGENAVLFYEHEDKVSVRDVKFGGGDISVFIGAEGGFSEREIDLARKEGVRTVSLGKRILRTETASVVALALVNYISGGMDV